MERKLREASMEAQNRVRIAVWAAIKKQADVNFENLHEEICVAVEESFGPFDKIREGFGTRFTKLQAEPDGYHEYITLIFL